MESGAPEVMEVIPWILLPPACREEILGDLRERYQSVIQYLFDCAQVIPCVIYSRMCRTTDGVVALMQGGAMYTALMVAAWWLDRGLFLDRRSFAVLAIPTAIVLAATVLGDAYNDPSRRWPLKSLLAPAVGFSLASIAQSMFKAWALETAVFRWGGVTGLLFVFTLRVIFPPIFDRPLGVSGPSDWRKLELAPLWRDNKAALLIVLAVVLYLIGK